MSDLVEDYWAVSLEDGGHFRVSTEVAKEVERDLEAGVKEWIRFVDIAGSPCMYRAAQIIGVWECSAVQRDYGYRHQKMLDKENAPEVPGVEP